MAEAKTAVVALGGNAISREGEEDTIPKQFENTNKSLTSIVELIKEDYHLAITHGNGPQVGNAILRVELARSKAPALPLYVCVADTEGGMGFMVEQCLKNRLKKHKSGKVLSTKSNLNYELEWYCGFKTKSQAIAFEQYLKSGSGRAFMKKRFFSKAVVLAKDTTAG